ncbi:chitinase [Streptomyces sp. NPDC001941]|uniref:chitinase n=1 Tax=Streptomyces sp. NPDC001941 TaxID=3154659 RepID=UPI00332E77F5
MPEHPTPPPRHRLRGHRRCVSLALCLAVATGAAGTVAGLASQSPPPAEAAARPAPAPSAPRPTRAGAASRSPGAGNGAAVGRGTAVPAGFSPYLDVSLGVDGELPSLVREYGLSEVTLAFVLAGDGCRPRWGGGTSLGGNPYVARIGAVRAAGADVRVSFGGADGRELATVCADVPRLTAAYRSVVDALRLTRLDFDVEGSQLADTDAHASRARAVAALQQEAEAAGRPLDVTFTLPVMPSGLSDDSLALLRDAYGQGVRISAVNIMAMDYGSEFTGDMGGYARRAATATAAQLAGILDVPAEEAWSRVGITVMTGVNDVAGEVFTVEDAAELLAFAREKRVGRLSTWSLNRDRLCPDGPKESADPLCGSIGQEPFAFTRVLAGHRPPTGG